MQQSTREALEHFTNIDTWHTTHPLDEERFLDFISAAYRAGDYEIDTDEFMQAFPEDISEHLEERAHEYHSDYVDGISLLRRFHGE